MTIPLSKRNYYMESPVYKPDPALELQLEYTKLIAAYHALDGISERVDAIGDRESNIFHGALRIIEAIIPRIEEIQEAIPQ
jgi:hypothetical protein